MSDIKKDLENEKSVNGTERTLKKLKLGELKKVYVSVNCPEDIREDLEHYTKINKTELIYLKENNEELGVICKKPFPISILGIE
jgi:large subunit ribosomal protein L30e